MDYEKAYKDALESARKFYNDCVKGDNPIQAQRYVDIFPELNEQPDPRHSLIEFIKWSCDRGCITPEQRKNVDFWLAYLEKQKEQKPAEWSKEDNINLNACIQIINDEWEKAQIKELGTTKFAPYYYGDLIDWLKSLRPQLKREAWTEEDSLAIKEIQNALEIYKINHGISEKQRKKLARWLDIHCNAYPIPAKLYPHWEPSKEQLNALHAFVGMIHPDARYDAVLSLLNDLQKLL